MGRAPSSSTPAVTVSATPPSTTFTRGLLSVPPEVMNLRWIGAQDLHWDPVSSAPPVVQYHVYRGTRPQLGYTNFGACLDGIDGNLADTSLHDGSNPPPAGILFYVVTAENSAGNEGTMGFATCAERSNYAPCP